MTVVTSCDARGSPTRINQVEIHFEVSNGLNLEVLNFGTTSSSDNCMNDIDKALGKLISCQDYQAPLRLKAETGKAPRQP